MVAVFMAALGATALSMTLLKVWGQLPTAVIRDFFGLQTLFLGLSVLAWMRWVRPTPLSIFGKPKSLGKEIGWGLLFGIGTVFANGFTSFAVQMFGRLLLGHRPTLPDTGNPHGALEIVLFGIVVVIGAPLAEELFFRGFVYGGLRRWLIPKYAVPISALAFGLAHLYLLKIPSMFVVGLIFAIIYEKRCNLAPTIVAHLVNNAVAFFLLVTLVLR